MAGAGYNPHHSMAFSTGTSPTAANYPSPTSSAGPFPVPAYGPNDPTKQMNPHVAPASDFESGRIVSGEYQVPQAQPLPVQQQIHQVQQPPQQNQYGQWNYYQQGQT